MLLISSVVFQVQFSPKKVNSDAIKEITSKGRDSLYDSRLFSSLLRNIIVFRWLRARRLPFRGAQEHQYKII